VVTKDVPDFALVVGVPARRIGWVGRSGVRLVELADSPGDWQCPRSGARYRERAGGGRGDAPTLVEVAD
jgi:UDP-2-acetamido-3-amino-2,3-dideoxy-glucuronate N-acetyltransferase